MTQTKTTQTVEKFGTVPKDVLFLPDTPYAVRADCKSGQFKIGDKDFIGDKLELSLIKKNLFYGAIGFTEETWLQLFFIPAPSCLVLPANTVCVTYLKTRSIEAFEQKLTELRVKLDKDPGDGIFTAYFKSHSATFDGKPSEYFSVAWDWRERATKEEKEQLILIDECLPTLSLVDPSKADLLLLDSKKTEKTLLAGATKKGEVLPF